MDHLTDAYLDYSMRADGEDPLASPPLETDSPGYPLPVMDLVDTFSEFRNIHSRDRYLTCFAKSNDKLRFQRY